MGAIRRNLRGLLSDQGGATAVEYGLIAALIVVAMIGALGTLGGGVGGKWNDLGNTVSNIMG